MRKISECKLARKLQASNNRGLLIGLAIGITICLVAAGILIKLCWLKRKFECLHYDLDDLDDLDGEYDDCDCDETGCSYTSEKDFVQN